MKYKGEQLQHAFQLAINYLFDERNSAEPLRFIQDVPDNDISLMHKMQVCAFFIDINNPIFNILVRLGEVLEF